tara:strand:+ start:9 stop:848 length:840 start_codon:yes stop_codon:yes gene_type:complete
MMAATGSGTDKLGRLRRFIESDATQRFIIAVIVVNAVVLGLETSPTVMAEAGPVLEIVDKIAVAIFVAEIAAKLAVYRLGFFRNAWNIFDFTIVALSLIPAGHALSAFRAFRVLRALRLMSMVPKMRAVVQALLQAIPGMGAIMLLLLLIFYVFSVIATTLFGPAFDDWFGTIGRSFYTLFQIMTLESWSMGIVRPVMDRYPLAWLYFVPFILFTTFAVLNLFIAIVVNSMQKVHEAEEEHLAQDHAGLASDHEAVLSEIRALRREVSLLRAEADGSRS